MESPETNCMRPMNCVMKIQVNHQISHEVFMKWEYKVIKQYEHYEVPLNDGGTLKHKVVFA